MNKHRIRVKVTNQACLTYINLYYYLHLIHFMYTTHTTFNTPHDICLIKSLSIISYYHY